jgi:hypothetical protein
MYPEEEMHVAHPRLYGAPAYARPPLAVSSTAPPPDPDDLPLEAEQTPEERALAEQLAAMPFGIARPEETSAPEPERRPQPILSVLTGRILRRAS